MHLKEKICKLNTVYKLVICAGYAVCGSKKSIFIKEHKGKRLLGSLGIKTPWSKVPLLGDILF